MARNSTNTTPQPAPELSEYEQARARNIEKNNGRLRSLGLISLAEEKQSNDMAWGRQTLNTNDGTDEDDGDEGSSSDEEYGDEGSSSDEGYTEGTKKSSKRKKKKKKRSSSALPPREGSRKSRRLMDLPSEYTLQDNLPSRTETAAERAFRIKHGREALVAECREARLRAAVEVANAGVQMAGKENPTATYEHCLMRVRSMTEKALVNRVRAIERAAGKHCVVKMAIFKSCLQDEDMWDLAKLASESLERLKALLPPPEI